MPDYELKPCPNQPCGGTRLEMGRKTDAYNLIAQVHCLDCQMSGPMATADGLEAQCDGGERDWPLREAAELWNAIPRMEWQIRKGTLVPGEAKTNGEERLMSNKQWRIQGVAHEYTDRVLIEADTYGDAVAAAQARWPDADDYVVRVVDPDWSGRLANAEASSVEVT